MEKVYNYSLEDKKVIEVIVQTKDLMLNHIRLEKGDALPIHNANSDVYLTIVSGILSIGLNDNEPTLYEKGSIVNVEYGTKMEIKNTGDNFVEFFVVKAPHPDYYQK